MINSTAQMSTQQLNNLLGEEVKPNRILTPHDKRLFRNQAVPVYPHHTNEEILASANALFEVNTKPVQYETESGVHTVPNRVVWYRSDNDQHLGVFGTVRNPIQPVDLVEYFKTFTMSSEKLITLDAIFSVDGGKTWGMGSKLTNDQLSGLVGGDQGFRIQSNIPKEERTDVWLVVTDYLGESRAPKAYLLFNTLVCDNGMTRKVEEKVASLTHLRKHGCEDVHSVLRKALRQHEAFHLIQDRMINTQISREFAINALKEFCDGQPEKFKSLERIYTTGLIGGHLDSRKGTAWGLLSAVTQHTSQRSSNEEGAMKSQLVGARGSSPQKFLLQLSETSDALAPIRELVTA
tara:strand:+ start:44 stop:1090 length:1047 start_codon:yes stop_codon:yes gene_type:complete